MLISFDSAVKVIRYHDNCKPFINLLFSGIKKKNLNEKRISEKMWNNGIR